MTYRNLKGYKYEKADKYFIVNDGDDELSQIVISLPKPPSMKYIEGYGEEPLTQKWKRLEVPKRLVLLEKRVYKDMQEWSEKKASNIITGYRIIKRFWETLTEEQESYREEIEYIKKIAWCKVYGYWCFIKGKPVYFPPQYFMFLNFWKMPHIEGANKYPEFREEDRITELFKYYLMTTKETFKNLDKKGRALKNKDGKYEMIEMVNRTFFGCMIPKRRRCGETNRALNNGMCIVTGGISSSGAIMADTGKHAEEHWEKRLIPAWQSFPLFLKPIWDGNNSPVKLSFNTPGNVYNERSLKGLLKYLSSATERAADSDKLNYILADESGKLERVDAGERWGVTKFTLAQGPAIHGWAELPSTVEEMTEGGEQYYDMWKNSDFYTRDKVNGQTLSGLGRKFSGAHRGYDGFIDPWGYSVVNTPTKEQIEHAPKNCAYKDLKIGSLEYHIKRREQLLTSVNSSDRKEYRGLRRREPIQSNECWMGTSGDMGFPMEEMDKRLAELRVNNYNEIVTGDFVWRNGIVNGIVDFVQKDNGKCNVSLLLDNDKGYKSNQRTILRKWNNKQAEYMDVFAPVNKSLFTVGVDPIMNLSRTPGDKTQSRLSDGGISVYWEVDKIKEPNWNSDTGDSGRFVCTYRYRPDNFFEFVDDVIKISVYFGGMMFFERNKNELVNRIDDLGYSGYFKYAFNLKTNMFEQQPGGYAGGESINELFIELRDYLDLRVHKEVHHDFLNEAKNITGREKLGRNDLLAACGWALIGSKSTYGNLLDKMSEMEDEEDDFNRGFLKRRSY